jgi:hypothetical protein
MQHGIPTPLPATRTDRPAVVPTPRPVDILATTARSPVHSTMPLVRPPVFPLNEQPGAPTPARSITGAPPAGGKNAPIAGTEKAACARPLDRGRTTAQVPAIRRTGTIPRRAAHRARCRGIDPADGAIARQVGRVRVRGNAAGVADPPENAEATEAACKAGSSVRVSGPANSCAGRASACC